MTRGQRLSLARAIHAKQRATNSKPTKQQATDRDRRLIVSLHLSGFNKKEIEKVVCVPFQSISAQIARIDKQVKLLGNSTLLALLKSEFVGLFDRHTLVTQELIRQYAETARLRDRMQAQPAGTDPDKVGANRPGPVPKHGPKSPLTVLNERLLSLGRQLVNNDDQFIQTVARVGVPDAARPQGTGTPLSPSTLLPDGSGSELVGLAKELAKKQLEYLERLEKSRTEVKSG